MSFPLSTSSQKTLNQSLREKGLRPTKQRACVYGVILDKRDHPTADDIYDRVKKQLPGTSFATVYNCLETLVGCELVRQVHMDRSPTRYCPNLSPHAHFKCKNTGKIYDIQIDEATLTRIEALIPSGFTAENLDLSFSGTGLLSPN
jgi:Fur family peroxide stress response transcriptional regulator